MASSTRSPFTAPGELGRGWLRAGAEVFGAGVVILMTAPSVQTVGGSVPGEVMLVLGCVLLALLVVRRRFPSASLLGVSVLMSVFPAAGMPAAVIAYTAAKQLKLVRRRTAVLLGSTVLVVVLNAVLAPILGVGSHFFGLALGAVLASTTLIVPGLVGTAAGQQERLLEALRERAAAAEEARRLADSESRIHERSRIAAEMHDLVGHRLSLISLHSGGLEMALEKQAPELRDEAAVVRKATGDAMRELREVLGVLGPLGRDTGTGALTDSTGTRPDIEALAEESRRVGIPVDLSWDGPDLDGRAAQVRRAVHRVVRESLTNVHRYAAGAHVTVSVTHDDERVDLLVRNGVPPLPPPATTGLGSGRGLVGLRERVGVLGGTLEARPTPAGGFAVTASIPAEPDPAAALADTDDAPPHEPSYVPVVTASRLARLQRRFVSGLTGLLGLAGVGVMMLFGLLLVDEAQPGPELDVPDEPRIGMSRAKVLDAVYGDDPVVRAAATGHEPDRPEDVTSCVYPMMKSEHALPSTDDWETQERLEQGPGNYRITRYCFRGEKLAAIDRFTVPMVSQTPPWEAP